jgi:hypothetical protein
MEESPQENYGRKQDDTGKQRYYEN